VYLQPEAKDPVLSTATVLAIAAAHTDADFLEQPPGTERS